MSIIRSASARQIWRSCLSAGTSQCTCRHVSFQPLNRSIRHSLPASFRAFGSVATQTVPEPVPHMNVQSFKHTIPQPASVESVEPAIPQPAPSQSINQAFSQTVELTDAASNRISQLRAKHGPNTALRLSIDSGGCSGMSYKFEIDTAGPEEGDQIFTNQTDPQSKLIVDSFSLEHLAGSIIDYRSRIERSGFEVVANPNAAGKCGCGTSFQPKNF